MHSPSPAIQHGGPFPSWNSGSGPRLLLHVLNNLRTLGLLLSDNLLLLQVSTCFMRNITCNRDSESSNPFDNIQISKRQLSGFDSPRKKTPPQLTSCGMLRHTLTHSKCNVFRRGCISTAALPLRPLPSPAHRR